MCWRRASTAFPQEARTCESCRNCWQRHKAHEPEWSGCGSASRLPESFQWGRKKAFATETRDKRDDLHMVKKQFKCSKQWLAIGGWFSVFFLPKSFLIGTTGDLWWGAVLLTGSKAWGGEACCCCAQLVGVGTGWLWKICRRILWCWMTLQQIAVEMWDGWRQNNAYRGKKPVKFGLYISI